jgi:hypothetical protein
MDIGIFKHGIGLVIILLSYQAGVKILLVTGVDFVVSFIHLECAPFGCIGYTQYPIITINEAHFRDYFPFFLKNYAGIRARP